MFADPTRSHGRTSLLAESQSDVTHTVTRVWGSFKHTKKYDDEKPFQIGQKMSNLQGVRVTCSASHRGKSYSDLSVCFTARVHVNMGIKCADVQGVLITLN